METTPSPGPSRPLSALLSEALERDPADRDELLDELRNHELDDLDPAEAGAVAGLLARSGQPADLPEVARLSFEAHTAGIEGAGLVHAEASDKIALYTGRPQLYGTVMLEQNGEILQPPVDQRVSDDERAALGVPTMAELERRMRTMTRELAIERASIPGALPAGQRWCRVWSDPDPAELRSRMAVDGSARADGDVLTLVNETDVPFVATPSFGVPTWPAGDGLQVLSLRVERLDEAILTYTFTPVDTPPEMRMGRGSHDGRFRGSAAPAERPSNDPLVGSMIEHAIESEALGEPRRVTVYRPNGHESGDGTPVVYATDGNMFAPYARRLDAAIEAGDCPAVVVVAAHSAGFDPLLGNVRAAEYLPGFDEPRFDAHHRFFVDELAAWAEATFGVPDDRERRAVFGCSDGGGHSMMIARLQPHRFGHVLAFSTGMAPDPGEPWDADRPFVHLCCGTLEGPFHQATEAWAGFLHLHGAAHHFTERVAGHDLIQWAEELPAALHRAFA